MKIISIVTINLNNKNGLEKSIKSLLNQQAEKEIEFIVIDGLSQDGSSDIINDYKKFIDIVKMEKDNGIFDAMNKGINLATGQYIYFLNSGDEFASNSVIKKVIEAMKTDKGIHNIICGKVDLFNQGQFFKTANLSPWIPHQGAFVKSNILKKYLFDHSFRVYGDLDLWTRMKNQGDYSVCYIDYLIANFELDGVGNDPAYLTIQYQDQKKYCLKHRYFLRLLATSLLFYFEISLYNLLGRKYFFMYVDKFSSFKQLFKRMVKSA